MTDPSFYPAHPDPLPEKLRKAAMGGEMPAPARLRRVLGQVASLLLADDAAALDFRMRLMDGRDPVTIAVRDLLADLHRDGVEAGLFRPHDSLIVADLCLAPFRHRPDPHLVRTHLDILLRGLATEQEW